MATARTKATKPALSKVRIASVNRAPKRELTLEEMAQKELGWDPRITVYVTDERVLKKYQRAKGQFFAQLTGGEHIIGGWKLQQVGAWRENPTSSDRRIVWVQAVEEA